MNPQEWAFKVGDAIVAGKLDDQLSYLQAEINTRRDRIRERQARKNAASIHKGDVVQLIDLRPKYLTLYQAEVLKPATAKGGQPGFMVNLLDAPPVIRRYRTQGIVVPASCVRKIDD